MQPMLYRPYNNLNLRPLRPRQAAGVDAVLQAVKEGHKRIAFQAPCGYGKTRVGAEFVARALGKGKRPLFTAPAISLIDQTVKAFEREGIRDIGVMQADHERTDQEAQVQIASVQTLIKRALPNVDFIMIDEFHRNYTGLNAMLDGPWRDKIAIGFSATPWVKGMGLRWSKLIISATIPDLISEELLTPTQLYVPEQIADRENIAVQKGEFTEASSSTEMRQNRIVGNVVETWKKLGPGEKTFMFCVNLDHARAQMAAFLDSGIPFGYIDANTSREDRTDQFRKMKHGEIAGIASVGCLIAGVDEDVRCVVDAAPTKSEISLVQRWGRGIRTAIGKTCIARDSLVLTQHGLVKIQDITIDHMVWDGVSFVHHKGAICRGVKYVIEHDGIVGTPDHEVMTDDGFQELAEAKRRQKRIATTGFGRFPLRLSEDSFKENRRFLVSTARGGAVRELWENTHGPLLQHAEATEHGCMPTLQSKEAAQRYRDSEVAFRALRGAEIQMRESKQHRLPVLRGARYQIPVRWPERSSAMDSGELGNSAPILRTGPDTEQWELRAWEFAVGDPRKADEQYEMLRWNPASENNRISETVSSREVCGSDIEPLDGAIYGRRDTETLGTSFLQTEREVWDILSAGALQRFTVNGKLVHNCLIGLDHAGNNTAQGLGLYWEIFHDHLDTHKPGDKGVAYEGEKRPAKPRQCAVCNCLIPLGRAICANCGAAMNATGIEHEDGELVVYGTQPREKATRREYTMQEKQDWFSGFLWLCRERGKAEGAAAHRYRDKFGVWPNKLLKVPRPPTLEVMMFEKHCRIKYAKSKEVAGAQAG